MSRRPTKQHYWQSAPVPRQQMVLVTTALEDLIGPDHPVRLVDEILDQIDWSSWEAEYHGRRGQPPIHPSILAKVLLFALIRRTRSSRQIEYQLKHSIDFMWLASGRRIDHTTLSEFRRKHASGLRDLFRQMIGLAVRLGVANLSELCIDGSRVLANAKRAKTWTTERLARALQEVDAQLVEALKTLEANDAQENDLLGENESADRLPKSVADLQSRREQLKALKAQTEQMDESRRQNRMPGAAQLPKTDLDSRILPNKEGGYAPNYTPMAATETGGGLIVMADVLIGNVEHDQFDVILDEVEEAFDIEVERVLADAAYTTGENLVKAERREVELIGPLAETKCAENPAFREDPRQPIAEELIAKLPIHPQTQRIDKSAFVYDEQANCYYCPTGKRLVFRRVERSKTRSGEPLLRSLYIGESCQGCPLAALCRSKPEASGGREVRHDQYETARREHRQRMSREDAQQAYLRRLHNGETPFAVIKQQLGLRQFLLRGLAGVQQEWRWAATAFNIKKLMSLWATLRTRLAWGGLGADV